MNRLASSPLYTRRNTTAERRRGRIQDNSLRAHSAALFERVDLRPGATAIDLGCGSGETIDVLSERVGRDGRVVGIDVDAASVAAARDLTRLRGLTNVEVMTEDARHTGLPGSSFDLVHSRLLLANISEPEEVVAEMARLARPGGWVTVMEADGGLHVCPPPHPGWLAKLTELQVAIYRQTGAGPYVARRLPHLLACAGLVNVSIEARAELCPPGDARRTVLPDLVQNVRARTLERGILGVRELDRLDGAAGEHLADPDEVSVPVTYFLAWARKPEWAA